MFVVCSRCWTVLYLKYENFTKFLPCSHVFSCRCDVFLFIIICLFFCVRRIVKKWQTGKSNKKNIRQKTDVVVVRWTLFCFLIADYCFFFLLFLLCLMYNLPLPNCSFLTRSFWLCILQGQNIKKKLVHTHPGKAIIIFYLWCVCVLFGLFVCLFVCHASMRPASEKNNQKGSYQFHLTVQTKCMQRNGVVSLWTTPLRDRRSCRKLYNVVSILGVQCASVCTHTTSNSTRNTRNTDGQSVGNKSDRRATSNLSLSIYIYILFKKVRKYNMSCATSPWCVVICFPMACKKGNAKRLPL